MATASVLILLASLLPALAAGTDCCSPAADYGLALTPSHECGVVMRGGTYDMGTYAPGSAYEASLRHLVTTIPAKANAESSGSCYYRDSYRDDAGADGRFYVDDAGACGRSYVDDAGESPNRIVASADCSWHPDAKSPDCGACIALAFQEAQRLCPFQRMAEAAVDGGSCNCSAHFHDYDIMEQFHHGDLNSDPRWAPDQVMRIVAENEENNTRMRWACRILETTVMEILANLGWISSRRICA
ncbi:unnamed protein product [Triticum turgidum subsp. durum]|uniref:Gnk2-homologous domain-containing protein n=1 Tax=Triticum turgidum subsp. durum TaxID=4567 RepID=A0A9R1QTB4_TRITD|nr:unnamed protein product [Triticum turgidum subsp. durum]